MEMNDQTLLQQWYGHGDAEAFHQITRRYAGLVYGTCRRILHNASDAEDVAQECFETLALKTRTDGKALGAWLHTVATRRALDRIKTDTRRRDREHRAAAASPAVVAPVWDDLYAHVDEAIAALPEKERVPLVAHFLEGQTHEAIAAGMGIRRPTVGYRIQRGLERIRKDLKHRNITIGAVALGTALGTNLGAEAAPVTLTAALGKLALSGAPIVSEALSTTPMVTSTIAGSIVMKKALIIGAIVVAIAGGAGLALRQPPSAPLPVAPVESPRAPSDREETGAADAVAPEAPPARTPAADAAPELAKPDTEVAALTPEGLPDASDAGLGDLAIAGRVVDTKDKPIAGVFIQIFGQGGNPHTRSLDDGSFRLTGLAPGLYSAQISHDTHSSPRIPSLEAGNEDMLIVMEGRATVSGRVVDAHTGQAVPRFAISSQGGITSKVDPGFARNRREVIDPRGHFELAGVETGESTLIVQAGGYAAAFTPLHLETSDPVRDLTVTLQPGSVVEGRVTDSAGDPVAGAWIFAQTPPPVADLQRAAETGNEEPDALRAGLIDGVSGEEGAFTLNTLQGNEESLHAFHPKHGRGTTVLAWSGATPLRGIEIILENAVGAVDVLVTVEGEPAENSTVFATPAGGLGEMLQKGVTGADGRVTLSDLPAGAVGITAVYPGQQRQFMRRITLNTDIENGATASAEVDFPATTASLEGQVRLGEQVPNNGNLMLQVASGERMEMYMGNFKADGGFAFESVIAGEATLQINAMFAETRRSKAVSVTLIEGEGQVMDIDLSGGGTVAGAIAGMPAAYNGSVVVLRGEHAIAEISMEFVSSLAPVIEGSNMVEPDGSYTIEGLAAGHYTVLLFVTKTRGPDAFDDARFATAGVDVVEGETAMVDFDMSE